MEPLRIHLFGGFLLERGDWALAPIASRAGRSLFAYLVTNRDRPLQRDYVAGTFWPDLPEGRARRRLSHTLWQIQDVVNTDSVSYLDVTTDTLAFDAASPVWVDVEEFDRVMASGGDGSDRSRGDGADASRLRTAVELYRGDFLAGYFDDWVLVEQDLYRQKYLTALRRLVDATKAEGAYDEALSLARRLTHHDPLSEEAHQEVMRLSFLLGRTNDAIEQFERCRSVLEEELGAEPSAPTVEIYQKILRQRRAGIRPLIDEQRSNLLERRADSPFVGRDEERRLLVDSLERVLTGRGGVVLIEGEPGVGKTRLTEEMAEDARWRGFEVTWGSCTPGALRPFAPLIEVLESLSPLRVEQLAEQVAPIWLGEAIRLAPGLGGEHPTAASAQLRPAEASTRMKEALVHTLGALGKIAPHLIVIDDVQWADQDTLSVLTQIGPRLAESRVLLMPIYRSEEARGDAEVWDVLRDLDRAAGLGRVVLSPLSVFELDEMVRRILGVARLDPGVAAQLHRQTGGNVLFTLETLLAMRDRGLFSGSADPVRVLEQELDSHSIPLAPRVRSVIESRMSLLGDDVVTVYELAAVTGDRIDLPLLEATTDLSKTSVLAAVDELLYRGLIRDDGSGRYRLAHDQVRQVIYESIAPGRRAHLHTLVAETLAVSDPKNVEAIGHHFREGGDSERATTFLWRAGRRAVGLNAYATARHYLQSARQAAIDAGLAGVDRHELLGQLEDVLNVLGARGDQHEVLTEMADLVGSLPALRGDLERRRAWLQAQEGELRSAETSAQHAVAFERSGTDGSGLSSSLVALGTIQRWSGRAGEAVPGLEEAVGVADDDAQTAIALTELASTLVELQRDDVALENLRRADRIYEALDDLRGRAEVAGIEARALHQRGSRDPAAARYRAAIELCRRIGYRHGEGVNLTNLANLQQLLGGVAESLDGYDQAARIFDELGNRRGEAMVLANSASARHHLLGEDQRARIDAMKAMNHFTDIGDLARQAQCQEIVAGITARDGDRDEAVRLLRESLAALTRPADVGLRGQHLRSLALVQIKNDDLPAAHATLDEAERLCAEAGLDDLAVELLSVRGLALLREGDPKAALALARQAVASLSPGVERPFLIHHRHALAAEACGERDEARSASLDADALLREALAGLTASSFHRAVQLVPVHRDIVAAANRFAPHVIEVLLPLSEAPTGVSLGDEDLKTVQWTVDHPDDDRVISPIDRRRQRLLRLVAEAREQGVVASTADLAQALAISASTVSRDLAALRNEGHMVATRGQRRRGMTEGGARPA